MKRITFPLIPVPKPRQTKQDKWLNPPRPAVAKYRQFEDNIQALAAANQFTLPLCDAHFTFEIPMPPSWSAKRKAKQKGTPHQHKPDLDNLLKAVFDALSKQDCLIWHIAGAEKRWAEKGSITITECAA